MIQKTVESFSEVNILVQNAAIGMQPRPFVETSEDLFDKLFAINVKSVYLGAKLVILNFKNKVMEELY